MALIIIYITLCIIIFTYPALLTLNYNYNFGVGVSCQALNISEPFFCHGDRDGKDPCRTKRSTRTQRCDDNQMILGLINPHRGGFISSNFISNKNGMTSYIRLTKPTTICINKRYFWSKIFKKSGDQVTKNIHARRFYGPWGSKKSF
jgi:hypothetical protein